MPRGRRKVTFIGSAAWKDRDVTVALLEGGMVRFTDKPSGIWAQVPLTPHTARMLALRDLAHRVIQLTT